MKSIIEKLNEKLFQNYCIDHPHYRVIHLHRILLPRLSYNNFWKFEDNFRLGVNQRDSILELIR